MPPEAEEPVETRPALSRGIGLTRRALVFLVVAAVLVLSFASSLRVYFRQQSQIAATQAEIAARQNSINDLQQQVNRWNDPTYVKAQARTRLGWVMPGEIGYQVIGADGNVLSPSVTIEGTGAAAPAHQPAWWSRLTGSLAAADHPTAVSTPTPSATPTTITPTTTPTPAQGASTAPSASSTPTR